MSDIEAPDITARELLTRADGIIQWACDTNAGDAWRAAAKTWTDLNGRYAPVLDDAYEEGFSAGAESVGTVAGEPQEFDLLTLEQEIRAKALDSAARLLGPRLDNIIAVAPHEATTEVVAYEWLLLADAAARYIAAGEEPPSLAEPAPPLEGGGAAEAGRERLYCAECGTRLDKPDAEPRCPDCGKWFCGDTCRAAHSELGVCPDSA